MSIDRIDVISKIKLSTCASLHMTIKCRAGKPFCDLFIKEKLSILKLHGTEMLQENENFILTCPHTRKFKFRNYTDEDKVQLMKS